MRPFPNALAAIFLGSFLWGCGGSKDVSDADAGTDAGSDAPSAPSSCSPSAALQVFSDGSSQAQAVLPSAAKTYQVSLCSAPNPPVRGFTSFTYLVTDSAGTPQDGLTLSVQTWMPDMGHGGPTTPTVTGIGSGLYQVTNCVFQMAGVWEMRTTITGSTQDATPDTVNPEFNIY